MSDQLLTPVTPLDALGQSLTVILLISATGAIALVSSTSKHENTGTGPEVIRIEGDYRFSFREEPAGWRFPTPRVEACQRHPSEQHSSFHPDHAARTALCPVSDAAGQARWEGTLGWSHPPSGTFLTLKKVPLPSNVSCTVLCLSNNTGELPFNENDRLDVRTLLVC